MSPIAVVDYDPGWPAAFEALRQRLSAAVGDIALSIEHVGSTSVPGLAAKPIIDLDIVVRERDVPLAIERVAVLGYRHLGDRGIPRREAFAPPASSVAHHLYVCPEGSPALRNHLAVRDHLRTNPAAAAAYGDLKKQLAARYADDKEGYAEAKTDFLTELLRVVGFEDSSLEQIRRSNRRSPGEGA
jgi:GrpB-like predicted nucleotidyltransferase (UPF0157 family)